MTDDWTEEEYYASNAIEGSARLRDTILRIAKAPRQIVWFEPEGCYAPGHYTIAGIQAEVACYFKINPQHMAERTRRKGHDRPRLIAMYLSRTLSGASFPKIGRCFNRDHTTILSACRAVASDLSMLREAGEIIPHLHSMELAA